MQEIADFMTSHARLLDRRRFDLAIGRGDAEAALTALAAYRNPDGGIGALEPDLRAPESQPAGALHALEVLEEVAPATSPLAADLCDWLAGASLPGGGLPFALPIANPAGTAPLWTRVDPTAPSLQITAAVTAFALRVARHDATVANHPWLRQATAFCLDRIAAMEEIGFVLPYRYALWFLDALTDTEPRAAGELERLAGWLPPSATVPVAGGKEGEAMRPLDFSPMPHRPLRALIDPDAIEADLDRVCAERRPDGGWDVDFHSYSPAAALEWRGYATVRAVQILVAHGRLTPA
jgi:hypothetical protein